MFSFFFTAEFHTCLVEKFFFHVKCPQLVGDSFLRMTTSVLYAIGNVAPNASLSSFHEIGLRSSRRLFRSYFKFRQFLRSDCGPRCSNTDDKIGLFLPSRRWTVLQNVTSTLHDICTRSLYAWILRVADFWEQMKKKTLACLLSTDLFQDVFFFLLKSQVLRCSLHLMCSGSTFKAQRP